MRRTYRILIVGALGAALAAGGAMSASAMTLPQPMPTSTGPTTPITLPPTILPTAPPTHPTPTTTAAPPTGTPTPTPTPSATPKPPTEQEIKDLFKLWNDALATKDPAKVADRYAPDAVLLPTVSNEVRKTREGIIDYFTHFLEKKPKGTIKDSKVKILGPTAAIDTGVYEFELTTGDVTTKVEARYTFVYEKVDGKWLIVNHHSSAMPEKK